MRLSGKKIATMKKPKSKYNIAMLIDDNEIDNFINQKMLEGNNFSEKIFVYSSGKSALEYFKNIEQDEKLMKELFPDFIFLDINMPVIDGFQFLQEFQKMNQKSGDKCKIVILTTSVNPSDKLLSLKNKFVMEYINKPLTDATLKNL